MRILVTGADGFVGPYLVRHLLEVEPDAEIVGTTRREPALGRNFSGPSRMRLVQCDVTEGENVRRLLASEAPDHVYHLAGLSSGAATNRDAVFAANVLGTQRLMAALAQEAPLARCLFTSTGYVYGPCDPARPAREADPLRPLGIYAESKQEAEGYARGAGAIIVRAFNHTGPVQSETFAVPAFARQIARIEAGRQQPRIEVGNLEAQRDFLDVRDVARAYRAVLTQGEPGATYNVCRGEAYSLEAVLSELLALSPKPIEVARDAGRMRPSDLSVSVGDPAKLISRTGWKPAIPFHQTLDETLHWWRAQT